MSNDIFNFQLEGLEDISGYLNELEESFNKVRSDVKDDGAARRILSCFFMVIIASITSAEEKRGLCDTMIERLYEVSRSDDSVPIIH